MSAEALNTFLRTIRDRPGYAQQVATSPSVMTGWELTVEERRAVLRRDLDWLREHGVEEELLPMVSVVAS